MKRQLRDSILKKTITQRESDYDKKTETRKWESSKRKKKSLVEDNNPIYLEGVRTMGKSDSAVPQMLSQHDKNGSIRPSRDSTEQGAGNNTCWCFRQ